MDKYEYKLKTEQMLELMENGAYNKAAEIADAIDWKRVRNATMLTKVSDIYEKNGDYQKGYDVLNIAYHRAEGSRKVLYRLCTLALKTGNVDEAIDYYDDFMQVAPKDPNQHILKYKILRARRAPIDQQIEALEEFKKAEYIEEWAYELAKLYQEAGMTAECLEECDDLILWFSEGKFVYKAMELKMQYKPLTPSQQEKYDHRYEKLESETEELPDLTAYQARKAALEEEEFNREELDEEEERRVDEKLAKTVQPVEPEEIAEEDETAAEEESGADVSLDTEEPEEVDETVQRLEEKGIGSRMKLEDALKSLLGPKNEVEDNNPEDDELEEEMPELEAAIEEIEAVIDLELVNELANKSEKAEIRFDSDLEELKAEPLEEIEDELEEIEDSGEAEELEETDEPIEEAEELEESEELPEEAEELEEAEEPIEEAEVLPEEADELEESEELPEESEELEESEKLPEEAEELEEIEDAEGLLEEDESESYDFEHNADDNIIEETELSEESVNESEVEDLEELEEEELSDFEEEDLDVFQEEELGDFEDEKEVVESEGAEEGEIEEETDEGAGIEEPETVENKKPESKKPAEDNQIEGQLSIEDILNNWQEEPAEEVEMEEKKKKVEPILPPDIQRMIDEIEGVLPEEPEPVRPARKEEDDTRENMGEITQQLRIDDIEEFLAAADDSLDDLSDEMQEEMEPVYYGMDDTVDSEYAEEAGYDDEGDVYADEDEYDETEYGDESESEFAEEEYSDDDEFDESEYEGEYDEAEYAEGYEDGLESEYDDSEYTEDEYAESDYAEDEDEYADSEYIEDEYAESEYIEDEDEYTEEEYVESDYAEDEDDYADSEYIEDEEDYADDYEEEYDESEYADEYEEEYEEEYEDEYLEDEYSDEEYDAVDGYEEADYEDIEASFEEEFRPNPEHANEPDDREIPDDDDDMDILSATTPLSRKETAKLIATGKTSPLPLDEISDALSLSDTGFIVHGRYDLAAQSGIGTRAGLTEEQKKLFSYFVPVRGMSEQLVDVLEQDRNCTNRAGSSRTGNLLIIGNKGNGKTVLAVDVVKAIQKQRNIRQGKVAIVTGDSLNKKKISDIFDKLYGGALIIEKASKMNEKTVARLNKAMERDTGEMLIVLEEQRKPLDRLLSSNREFRRKFTSRLEVPIFINDELVTFGQTYAQENGYRIDEMGILALYSRIDALQREDHAVTVAEVKEVMDEAMAHSQKASAKKLVKRVFGKNTDDADRIILSEKDFNV